MAYRLKTFRVQFVAESVGYPTAHPVEPLKTLTE
jgi:hypothetical protein